jgi:hypothetical protein
MSTTTLHILRKLKMFRVTAAEEYPNVGGKI